MNVVLPMAGRGTRFSKAGFDIPKPFIEVMGKHMFGWAIEGIVKLPVSKLIIVSLAEHVEMFELNKLLPKYWKGKYEIVQLDEVTEGQLSTVLSAQDKIDREDDLLIISSDTLVISDIDRNIRKFKSKCSGIISVMDSIIGDNWSFVKVDEREIAVEVAEKKRISDKISTGLYYFSNGEDFINYANKIINNNIRVRGEFYIIPLYNLMIEDGKVIRIAKSTQMWDMGTPEAKAEFEKAYTEKKVLFQ